MKKTLFFISGLPRSGSTLITNILKQNPSIHGESVSSLSSMIGSIHASWDSFDSNREYENNPAKVGVMRGVLDGYYSHIDKPIIFDKDRGWIPLLGLVNHITEKQSKVLVCVRNPAEILSSFEKLRKENPLFHVEVDKVLKENSSILTRSSYYADTGPLGVSLRNLNDAVTMGYLDNLLFVDYNRFCNSPKSQMKRIYDFFEIPFFEHDFNNINQTETYSDLAVGLPNLHKIKPKLERTTMNCVKYIGINLHGFYSKDVFWDAWI